PAYTTAPSEAAKTGCPNSPAISMPLFKLPFEENRPIICPFAGQAQPLAERATGLVGVVAWGGTCGALTMGGGVGTGVATTGVAGRGAGGGLAGRVLTTVRGALPSKRMR